ncbi:MAG: hypothetical protein O3B86_12955, partial [Planctomycetota bacterium]|nr:hypothetical protein [Planctomycetota bacterium]
MRVTSRVKNCDRWSTSCPLGFEAGDTNLFRYVGNSPTIATDPSGLAEIPLVHATTPAAAPGVIETGLQAGLDGGIWLATPDGAGGGASEAASVHLKYSLGLENVRDIPDEVIRDAQNAANEAAKGKGYNPVQRAKERARAKGDFIANWAKNQPETAFRMKAPPNHKGWHYFLKPEAWKAGAPKLTGIGGPGAEAGAAALQQSGVAAEAVELAGRAKWGTRLRFAAKCGGRALIVVGAATSGYEIYTAE